MSKCKIDAYDYENSCDKCSYYDKYAPDDIEFTGETEPIKSNAVIEDGQIRIWNYKTSKVEYYKVNEKTINKISDLLKSEVEQ